jgi:hypothetical protein
LTEQRKVCTDPARSAAQKHGMYSQACVQCYCRC